MAVTIAAWAESDWIARLATAWFLLTTTLLTVLVGLRWRHLELIVDAQEIILGKRSVRRQDVASIALEPAGDTASRFWFGVALMALTQDLSKRVNFRDATGRSLLVTTDIYGTAGLQELAAFLGVPLIGGERRR
ncbi:MAG TPA: hypothetical protein VLK30_08925 [Candidatus Limnocylindrales bacterium]|nr:hypothetical protein [Candidatus Limnocylindrales bacterium]